MIDNARTRKLDSVQNFENQKSASGNRGGPKRIGRHSHIELNFSKYLSVVLLDLYHHVGGVGSCGS